MDTHILRSSWLICSFTMVSLWGGYKTLVSRQLLRGAENVLMLCNHTMKAYGEVEV
jgi:hypothetical protein